jgi:hypothetical protein
MRRTEGGRSPGQQQEPLLLRAGGQVAGVRRVSAGAGQHQLGLEAIRHPRGGVAQQDLQAGDRGGAVLACEVDLRRRDRARCPLTVSWVVGSRR